MFFCQKNSSPELTKKNSKCVQKKCKKNDDCNQEKYKCTTHNENNYIGIKDYEKKDGICIKSCETDEDCDSYFKCKEKDYSYTYKDEEKNMLKVCVRESDDESKETDDKSKENFSNSPSTSSSIHLHHPLSTNINNNLYT